MGECEQLVHALWEYIVKRLTKNRDFYLLYDIKETCYAAGVKELDRMKQQVVTKPKKKEYLVKSLVKVGTKQSLVFTFIARFQPFIRLCFASSL